MDSFPQFIRMPLLFLQLGLICLFASGCGRNPVGIYEGEVRDWNKWVFEGSLKDKGQEHRVELILLLGEEEGGGGTAELSLAGTVLNGTWAMDGAKRKIVFGKDVYFLSKQGNFHVLQARGFKLQNDDESSVLLLLNKGRSSSRSVSATFDFKPGGGVLFMNASGFKQRGEWENVQGEIAARFEDLQRGEVHKFYFSWDDDDLLLRKFVISMGVGKKVGEEFGAPSLKSRSPRKVYDDPPRFRPR